MGVQVCLSWLMATKLRERQRWSAEVDAHHRAGGLWRDAEGTSPANISRLDAAQRKSTVGSWTTLVQTRRMVRLVEGSCRARGTSDLTGPGPVTSVPAAVLATRAHHVWPGPVPCW